MQPRYNVVIWEPDGFSTAALSLLNRLGTVTKADPARDGARDVLRDADILWVRLRERVDAGFLDKAPRLKILVTATTGLNHIDLAEAGERGIQVLSLRGETEFLKNVRATAEHTIALMLALMRHVPEASVHVREGGWNRDLFQGRELDGKTAGVIGYGRLGKIVSRYLLAFGMRVLAYDPNYQPADMEPGVEWRPLAKVLGSADIVTLHASYSPQREGMLGESEFAHMRLGSWFINTARGELVDELALLQALESGQLAGAALDVLRDEQSGVENSVLVDYARRKSNLLITPHISGCTAESMEKTEVFLAGKLCGQLLAPQAAGSLVAALPNEAA